MGFLFEENLFINYLKHILALELLDHIVYFALLALGIKSRDLHM